jgi:TP901 family phage tail tape measure protein
MTDYVVSTVFKGRDELSPIVDSLSNRIGIFSNKTNKGFASMGKSMSNFKSIVGGILTSNVVMGGINMARQGVVSMVDTVIDLDKALSGAASKFGFHKGTKDWETMEMAARKTGETTVYSAGEAAVALNEMGGAGKNLVESMALLPKLTTFSVAGDFEEMGSAMKLSASIMASLGLASNNAEQYAKNFEHVGDVMSKTDIIGLTSVQELGDALLNVSPMVKGGSDDIETLSAMLNTMAASGLRGERAGTDLAFAFRRLTQGIPAVRAQLDKYHISIEKGGKMRSMLDITDQLHKKLGKLSSFNQQKALVGIFGAWGSQAIMPIMHNLDLTHKSLEKIRESAGASMELADIKGASFANRIKGIKSKLSELGLKVFDVFEKDIYGAFDKIEKWLKDFDGEEFKKWVTGVYTDVKPLALGILDLTKNARELIDWFKSNNIGLMDIAKAFVAWKFAVLGLNVALAATKVSLGGILTAKGVPVLLNALGAVGATGAAVGGVAVAGAIGAAVVGNRAVKEQKESANRYAEAWRREKDRRIDKLYEGRILSRSGIEERYGGDPTLTAMASSRAAETGLPITTSNVSEGGNSLYRSPIFNIIPHELRGNPEKSVIEVNVNAPDGSSVVTKQGKNAPTVKTNLGSQGSNRRSLDRFMK